MKKVRTQARPKLRSNVHVTIDADLAARLRAFAGAYGRDMGEVVAEGLRVVLKGFSFRQEGPRVAADREPAPGEGEGRGAA